MKVTINKWSKVCNAWWWSTSINGIHINSLLLDGRDLGVYSTPYNAKRGFHAWRRKALIKLGATNWRADKTDIEFEVVR